MSVERVMGRYFHTESGWVSNPIQQNTAQILAHYDVGSVESRAAARALLVGSREEPLLIFPGDGTVYFHERCLVGETARELSRIVEQLRQLNLP
jgi:hypothetical protein